MRLQSLAAFTLALGLILTARADSTTPLPDDGYYAPFHPAAAPPTRHLLLRRGDRLAICGDSITEQKKYSRLIEDYLTVCVPQLQITTRQYGWSGEKAPGFLARMTNDCLRFHPTVATTCYGMNDFAYRPYTDELGQTYLASQTAIVEAFKASGARVILGSAGSVGKIPPWAPKLDDTLLDLNLSLCRFRNLDIDLAEREHVAFADVFWPMLTAGHAAQAAYGPDYALNGKDGVHPGWAGHVVMAYAFLKGMGLDGRIATFNLDLKRGSLKLSAGHRLITARDGAYEIESARYPFCPCASAPTVAGYPACGQDALDNDQSIRSGMAWVPFNQDLNRFMLVARHGSAASYLVAWGENQKVFTAAQLAAGLNLAAEFPQNPFSSAFARVDAAVAAKQAFETDEIKHQFEAIGDHLTRAQIQARTEEAVGAAEATHAGLADAVRAAFTPVTFTLQVTPQ